MNLLRGLWSYGKKVFALPQRLAGVANHRSQPEIATRSITVSLLLAALTRVRSFLQLQSETARPGWQRLTGWSGRISDDALVYSLERYQLQDLRYGYWWTSIRPSSATKRWNRPRSMGC